MTSAESLRAMKDFLTEEATYEDRAVRADQVQPGDTVGLIYFDEDYSRRALPTLCVTNGTDGAGSSLTRIVGRETTEGFVVVPSDYLLWTRVMTRGRVKMNWVERLVYQVRDFTFCQTLLQEALIPTPLGLLRLNTSPDYDGTLVTLPEPWELNGNETSDRTLAHGLKVDAREGYGPAGEAIRTYLTVTVPRRNFRWQVPA